MVLVLASVAPAALARLLGDPRLAQRFVDGDPAVSRELGVTKNDKTSFDFRDVSIFDPAWDARVTRIPGAPPPSDDAQARWDRASVHAFEGTWGDYLMTKISRVFPALFHDVV